MKIAGQKYWAITIFLLFLTACQKPKPKPQRPQPLLQNNYIQVYFNHNQAQGADYTEPYRKITRAGENLEQLIITAINSASYSIDLAIQELRLPNIALALAKQHQAGVKVRVILENNYTSPYSELTEQEKQQLDRRESQRYQEFIALADTNQDGELSQEEIATGDALVILANAGVPMIDDTADGSKGSGFMHHKFLVIDEEVVMTGSANFTTSGIHGDFHSPESRGNTNNWLRIESEALASLFKSEFNLMWGDGPGGKLNSKFGKDKPWREPSQVVVGDSYITVQFSPTSPTKPWPLTVNGLIGQVLEEAKDSVDLALFVFSEQKLADALAERNDVGVEVRALIDRSFAFPYYSEGLDMLGVALKNRCKYEKENNPWSTPINTVGVPQLPLGDKLHHKFAIIDGKTVITGSHNWSASANYNNDETLLVIEQPQVAAHFSREFERLYQKAVLGVPVRVQEKMKQQEEKC